MLPADVRTGDVDREFAMLIDGAWVAAESGQTFSCVDPYTEESWGRVPRADAADVARAVRAARVAFDSGGWPQTRPARRAALLRRLAQLIEENGELLALRQIRENGKLIGEMRAGSGVLGEPAITLPAWQRPSAARLFR